MEFPFDINPLFPERISVLDHHLQPGRRSGSAKATLENQLAVVLDKMGEASAKAQLLSAPITSASRMQVNRHRLYLLKDGHANHGKGAAVGFLKVGNKKLFVLDGQGAHNEMEPLCVLDFYVHISLQRHGYGKELFDYMVQYEGIKPDHLAIDRPSSKFLSFLRKHYGLAATIPQVNNFVVFESFFQDRQMRGARLVQRSAPKKVEQDIKPYSITVREGAPEDQELPWPFNQASSLTRSNSLGCSSRLIQPGQQEGPRRIRGLRSQLLNGAREADDTSAQRRRTCNVPVQKELVTAGEACATSGTPSPSLDLGQEKSAGPWPGQKSSGRIHHPGHGGTGSPRVQDGQLIPSDPKDAAQDPNPLPSGVFPPAQLPQPPPTLDQGAGGGPGAREGLIRREREEVVWSPWAETQLPSQAQWIRHKNKFRNTRPW